MRNSVRIILSIVLSVGINGLLVKVTGAQESPSEFVGEYILFVPFTEDPRECHYWAHLDAHANLSKPSELTPDLFLERIHMMSDACKCFRAIMLSADLNIPANVLLQSYVHECLTNHNQIIEDDVVPTLESWLREGGSGIAEETILIDVADARETLAANRAAIEILVPRPNGRGSNGGGKSSGGSSGGGIRDTPFAVSSPGTSGTSGGHSWSVAPELFRVDGYLPEYDGEYFRFKGVVLPETLFVGLRDQFPDDRSEDKNASTSALPEPWRNMLDGIKSLGNASPRDLDVLIAAGLRIEHIRGLVTWAKEFEAVGGVREHAGTAACRYLGERLQEISTDPFVSDKPEVVDFSAFRNLLKTGGQGVSDVKAFQPYLYTEYLNSYIPLQLQASSPLVNTDLVWRFDKWNSRDNTLQFVTEGVSAGSITLAVPPQDIKTVQIVDHAATIDTPPAASDR